MSRDEVAALLASHEDLLRQLDWFKRQLFGVKSERRVIEPDARQMFLGEIDLPATVPEEPGITVAEHQRRRRPQQEESDDTGLRFDDSVPVEEIRLEPADLKAGEGEVISEKVTYRLAQRPAAYVVLKYVRPVIKRQDGSLSCSPAPASVLGKSIADVSLLACLAIDKFQYHLPLYRQHQRMQAAGVKLARSTLTGLVHRSADLLEPIYQAQLASILRSKVLAMDETPIKAGRSERGRMHTGYFWPVFGDADEVVFPFSSTRAASVVRQVLGEYGGVLLSDGYSAYTSYAARIDGLVHAQCWSHARRTFVEAEKAEPKLAGRALDLIGGIFHEEGRITGKALTDEQRIEKRAERCKPLVDEFFAWLEKELAGGLLLPKNPFTEAAQYALERQKGLRVFLEHPGVPMDTNHLEREIRPIALGRKNWLFCWTEVGARAVGIFQSLLATCRLHEIHPYTYFVDVLQRVAVHPASDVALLTPRLWKQNFADNPLGSDLDARGTNADS